VLAGVVVDGVLVGLWVVRVVGVGAHGLRKDIVVVVAAAVVVLAVVVVLAAVVVVVLKGKYKFKSG
jgi:hypothetical protein